MVLMIKLFRYYSFHILILILSSIRSSTNHLYIYIFFLMYIMKVYLQDHFLKVSFMKFLNYSNTMAHEVEDYLVLPFYLLILELSVGDSSTKMVTFGAHDRSAC